jgi:hypothetical protein
MCSVSRWHLFPVDASCDGRSTPKADELAMAKMTQSRPWATRAYAVQHCGRQASGAAGPMWPPYRGAGWKGRVWLYRRFRCCCLRTPKSLDCAPTVEIFCPSTPSPRRKTSRSAAARLGNRCLNRKSSMAASSAADSIIWMRSARNRSAIATAYLGPPFSRTLRERQI